MHDPGVYFTPASADSKLAASVPAPMPRGLPRPGGSEDATPDARLTAPRLIDTAGRLSAVRRYTSSMRAVGEFAGSEKNR